MATVDEGGVVNGGLASIHIVEDDDLGALRRRREAHAGVACNRLEGPAEQSGRSDRRGIDESEGDVAKAMHGNKRHERINEVRAHRGTRSSASGAPSPGTGEAGADAKGWGACNSVAEPPTPAAPNLVAAALGHVVESQATEAPPPEIRRGWGIGAGERRVGMYRREGRRLGKR